MKFRMKMTLCMVSLLSVLFGIGGAVLISASFTINLEQEFLAARGAYQSLLNGLQLVNEFGGTPASHDLPSVVEELSSQTSAEWTSVRASSNGEVLYAAGPQADQFRDFNDPLEQDECLIATLSDGDGRYLQVSGLVNTAGQELRLDITRDCSNVYAMRTRQMQIYIVIFSSMLTICAALSYGFSRMLTKPLTQLTQATRQIADGDFSCRTEIQTSDEIGTLSEQFDRMAGQIEENVHELQDAVARQERFMGMFAHELKTPMTSIIGYADLLRGGTLNEEEQADAANYVFSEGKRLESLSLKLLNLLVTEHQKPILLPASPSKLAAEVANHWAPERDKEKIVLQLEGQEGQCFLEPDLFKSLVFNLLDNAKKALDRTGTIRLVTKMLDDGCVLEVYDSGRGIPEDALQHLTEAFYRVDKSRSRALGGVGLGLTLCNEIVRLHNGNLEFESCLGQGTCVRAVLRGGRP